MEYVKKGMQENKDTIAAGPSVEVVDKWYNTFGETYEKAADTYKPT